MQIGDTSAQENAEKQSSSKEEFRNERNSTTLRIKVHGHRDVMMCCESLFAMTLIF